MLSHPSKQLIKLLSTIRRLLCGNLVYNVGKSKVKTEVTFLRLLNSFIPSLTGLLFCTTQKVLTPVKTYNYHLSKKQTKSWFYSSGWRFYRRFKRLYSEFSFNRVFMHLRHPLHIRQSMIFNKNVVNTKFNFQIFYIFINYIICR